MHDRFEKLRNNGKAVSQDSGIRYLILPVFVVILLAIAAIVRPHTLDWVAQAVEAEFGGPLAPSGPAPTQLAGPAATPRETTGAIRAAFGGQR